jgi:surfactin synthase thioesterase subunit
MTEETTPDDIGLIRILQPATPSSFRLVCFPGFVNSTAYYLALAELLLPTVEVLVIQYPGDSGDPDDHCFGDMQPVADCEKLADRIFEALGDWTDRRLALFGHRDGAYLAYRVAERLERETTALLMTLFVSGRNAPGVHAPLGPPTLSCRIVALTGNHDPRTTPAGVRAWRRCPSGRFDLEVLAGAQRYLSSNKREIVNLVHDQLMSSSIEIIESVANVKTIQAE